MEQPIFYFKKLTTGNVISLISYVVISIIIYFWVQASMPVNKSLIVFFYGFLTAGLIYLFGYKALRNMTYFCCWVIISLIHLVVYSHIKDDPTYLMAKGSAAIGLRNIFFLLVLFQVLRFISLKLQHQEFVVPNRGNNRDLYDERKVNFLDIILFFIYIGGVVGFGFIA